MSTRIFGWLLGLGMFLATGCGSSNDTTTPGVGDPPPAGVGGLSAEELKAIEAAQAAADAQE